MQLGNEQAIPILLVLVIHYPANPFDNVCNWPVSGCIESSIHVTNADLEKLRVLLWPLSDQLGASKSLGVDPRKNISSESVPASNQQEAR